MTAPTVLYLLGVIPAYLLYRKFIKSDGGKWTISERRMGLLVSIFSWAGVLTYLLMRLIGDDNDKPAKW